MRIESFSVEACRLPPASPWEDATNKVDGLEWIFVELRTDTGLVGTGISYTVDVGGTAIAALLEDYLAPLVIGRNPLEYEAIWQVLQRQSRRLGLGVNAMAMAALDVAVWDLIGQQYRQPLWRLIGGARPRIDAYISEIRLAADDTVEDLLRRVDDYLAQGYRAVKMKIGHDDLEEDIERIRRVQEKLGRGGRLMVDLNQKWTPAEARVQAARLDDLGLGWIEEPLLCSDIASHRALRQSVRTPIALGESLYSSSQFLAYLQAEAVDIVQADVAFVGGVTEWIKVAHLAECFGKKVAPHFLMELSLQLLCGVPNGLMLENVVGGSLTELGLLAEPIRVEGALGVPSERPGHGIVLDWDAIRAHRLTPERVRASFKGGSK